MKYAATIMKLGGCLFHLHTLNELRCQSLIIPIDNNRINHPKLLLLNKFRTLIEKI